MAQENIHNILVDQNELKEFVSGDRTVKIGLERDEFMGIEENHIIHFYSDVDQREAVEDRFRVTKVSQFGSIEKMLEKVGIHKILLNHDVHDIGGAAKILKSWRDERTSRSEEDDLGVIALEVVRVGVEHLHNIWVNEIAYKQLLDGSKTVEGRLNQGVFRNISPGDVIRFYTGFHTNPLSGTRFRVLKRSVFNTFEAMLKRCTINSCLPHRNPSDLVGAVQYYRSLGRGQYGLGETTYKVVAYKVKNLE